MAENIFIPTDGQPTSPARKAWVGAAWGSLIGAITAVIAVPLLITNPVTGIPLAAILTSQAIGVTGAAIGYMMGKKAAEEKQAKELAEGQKEIKTPSFWNDKFAKTFAVTNVIGSVLTVGLATAGFAAASPLSLAIMLPYGLASIGAMIYKGFQRKHEMRDEYAHAEVVQEIEKQRSYTKARQVTISVDQPSPAATVVIEQPQQAEQPAQNQPSWQRNSDASWRQQEEARAKLRQLAGHGVVT